MAKLLTLKHLRTFGIVVLVIIVIAVSLYNIISTASYLKTMPPGDTFNVISIANLLLDFDYPNYEKRPLFYPFLIMLGLPFADPIWLAEGIAVLAAVVTLVAVFLLIKLWTKSWIASAIGALLLSSSSIFLIAASRPLSDILFASMVSLCLLVYFLLLKNPSKAKLLIFGIVLTLTVLTRYEGVILVVILLIAYLFSSRFRLKNVHYIIIPLVVGVLMVGWMNWQSMGSPLIFPYIEEARNSNYGVGNAETLSENAKQVLKTYSGVLLPPRGERIEGLFNYTEAEDWAAVKREVNNNWPYYKWTMLEMLWFFMFLAGAIVLVLRLRWHVVPIAAYILSHGLLVSWWTPYTRFYVPLTVIFFAIVGVGLGSLFLLKINKWAVWIVRITALCIIIPLLWIGVSEGTHYTKKKVEPDNYAGYTMRQAITKLSKQSETVAVGDRNLMVRLYFGRNDLEEQPRPLVFYRDELTKIVPEPSPDDEYNWVMQNSIRYLIISNEEKKPFQITEDLKFNERYTEVEAIIAPVPYDYQTKIIKVN